MNSILAKFKYWSNIVKAIYNSDCSIIAKLIVKCGYVSGLFKMYQFYVITVFEFNLLCNNNNNICK